MMEGLFVQTSAFGVAPTSPPPTFINEAALCFVYAGQPAPDGAGPSDNILNALTGDTPNYDQCLKDSDRISPADVSTQVSYQIVTRCQPLVLSAADRRSINGDGGFFQRTLLPFANFSIVSSEVLDIDSRTPEVASCYRSTTNHGLAHRPSP